MLNRKITIPVLILLFATSFAFCQSEVFKPVVNNLALYKKKKDLKYLAAAKKIGRQSFYYPCRHPGYSKECLPLLG